MSLLRRRGRSDCRTGSTQRAAHVSCYGDLRGARAVASLLAGAAQKAYAEAMNKLSPVLKFVGAAVLATAAFLGLFWLLFWRG